MVSAIKIVFLLGFLILIHESGHYFIAKLCKIKVNEFAIGFGPKIFSKKKNDTVYELRLIPLGGFVSLEGEEELSDKEGSFSKASIPKRIAIVAAGALVNIIFGLIVYFIIMTYKYLVVMNSSFMNAIMFGLESSGRLIIEAILGIFQLFTGKLSLNDFTGPVGISSIVSQTNGVLEFIYLLAIISISLGITNLLPFVPLDGGKIVIYIIEAIRKKPLKKETEEKIQLLGIILLISLSVVVTFNDVLKLIK